MSNEQSNEDAHNDIMLGGERQLQRLPDEST